MLDSADSNRPPRRSHLVAHELSRLNIDIAALNELRLTADTGSLNEHGAGCTIYRSGKLQSEQCLSGAGFMIKDTMASNMENLPTGHSDHIISMRLPLKKKQCVTHFSVYCPTLQAEPSDKDKFFTDLRNLVDLVRKTPADDKVIILGEFNPIPPGLCWSSWACGGEGGGRQKPPFPLHKSESIDAWWFGRTLLPNLLQ